MIKKIEYQRQPDKEEIWHFKPRHVPTYSLPRVSVQLQQSCCCVVAASASASSSWRQQSRQRPPASKMARVGHTVQLAGPGPQHSRQELSQSSQAWLEPWGWAGGRTHIEKATYPDTQRQHEFYITTTDSLLLTIQNFYFKKGLNISDALPFSLIN